MFDIEQTSHYAKHIIKGHNENVWKLSHAAYQNDENLS